MRLIVCVVCHTISPFSTQDLLVVTMLTTMTPLIIIYSIMCVYILNSFWNKLVM